MVVKSNDSSCLRNGGFGSQKCVWAVSAVVRWSAIADLFDT